MPARAKLKHCAEFDRNAPRRALLVGDWSAKASHSDYEFVAAHNVLRQYCEIVKVEPAEVSARLRDSAFDLLVLAVRWPNEFTLEHAANWHAAAPLTVCVAVLSSWCEGETRTGQPWPGVERLPWYAAAARLDTALGDLTSGRAGWLSQPRTLSPADRALAGQLGKNGADRRDFAAPGTTPLNVLCVASSLPTLDALVDACQSTAHRAWGLLERELPRSGVKVAEPVDVVLWDTLESHAANATRVALLVRQATQARIIALLNFPRWHDARSALVAGVSCVLAKPYELSDLDHAIRSCGRKTPTSS